MHLNQRSPYTVHTPTFLTPSRHVKKISKGSMLRFILTWSRNGRKWTTHHGGTLSPRKSLAYMKPSSKLVSFSSFYYCYSLMSLSSSAPPTQKKAYQALLTQEVNNKLAGLESGCGFTQLINNALHLEHDQCVVG